MGSRRGVVERYNNETLQLWGLGKKKTQLIKILSKERCMMLKDLNVYFEKKRKTGMCRRLDVVTSPGTTNSYLTAPYLRQKLVFPPCFFSLYLLPVLLYTYIYIHVHIFQYMGFMIYILISFESQQYITLLICIVGLL